MKPKEKSLSSITRELRERWSIRRTREAFFSHFRDLTRLSSNPLIPVRHSPEPPILAAMDSFKHSFLTDPPDNGRAFTLNGVRVGDSDTTLEYSDTRYSSLAQVLGTWHSGEDKQGVISKVLEFLRKECCLKNAVYATYYGGDNPDLEGRDLMLEHLPKENVFSSTNQGSFWNTGGIGPCGPCIRLYYDSTSSGYKASEARTKIQAGHWSMPLIWTFVFVKFSRDDDGVLEDLPFTHVITAMNFERVLTEVQAEIHFYNTDALTPLLDIIHEFAGRGIEPYNFYVDTEGDDYADDTDRLGMAYRVVADHLRMLSVASIEDTQLGHHGREYFLKYVDRQAIQIGAEKLMIPQKSYDKLVKNSIRAMAPAIPELCAIERRLDQFVSCEARIYDISLAEIVQRQPHLRTTKNTKGKAGTKQDGLEPSPPTTWYKTREIKFFDRSTHIVHRDCNKKCPLAALCNALLLGGKITLGANTSLVSESHLLHLVQSLLLCGNGNMELQNNLERSDFQKQVLDVLPRLSDTLPIDVDLDSISGFVDSPQTAVFNYLGVRLYHGCLVVPNDVRLAPGASKLTLQGLTSLRIELEEKEPCVLYWNGCLITATKVEGAIYLLLDGIQFVEKYTNVFWELLKEVYQGGLFMDGNFTCADLDPSLTTLPVSKSEKKKYRKSAKGSAAVTTALESGEDLVLRNTYEPDVPPASTSNACEGGVASCSTSKYRYQTRQINLLGSPCKIILQDRNGPCSLIAISNVLLMKGVISLNPKAKDVQEDSLINSLRHYLEERKGGLPHLEMPTEDVLQKLSVPVDVDLTFDRTDGFVESPEINLFRYLDIPIFHAWLPDPNDPKIATLSSYSYNSLWVQSSKSMVENVEHARDFIQGPQVTPYGLRCLRNDLIEKVPGVLFWQNHFSPVMKIKGEVYVLASVADLLVTSAVWYWFCGEKPVLVNSNFIPVDEIGQAHSVCSDLDVAIPLQNEECEEQPPSQQKLLQQQQQQKQTQQDPTQSNSAGQTGLFIGPRDESIPSTDHLPATNIISSGNNEEYVCTLEDFSEFRGKHFAEKKELSDSETSLEVPDTTIIGRIVATELLEKIVYNHQHGASWNGNFSRKTILVHDGMLIRLRVWISDVAGDFSVEAAVNDYTTYADEVLSLFEVEGVGYPAFFRSLIKTLKEESRLSFRSTRDKYNFHMKLHYNLALKCSLVRAEYWGGVHRVRRNGPRHVRWALRNVLDQEVLIEGRDWRIVILECGRPRLIRTLLHTEDYCDDEFRRNDESAEEKIAGNDEILNTQDFGNYLPSLNSVSQYPRHLNEHAPAEDDNGKVSMKSRSELDLWYSYYLEDPLDKAHELLLNSPQVTPALYDCLAEVLRMLERPDVILKYGAV